MSALVEAGPGLANSGQFHEWRRFLLGVLLVVSPIVICVAGLEYLAWHIGETVPMSTIAQWQSDGPDRMWRGGDGRSYLTYKVARVRVLKPEVIVLGASRATAFRSGPFLPYSFYNAGITAWTFDQYRRFLELTVSDDYAPKVLIFSFDYWMFSPTFEQYWVNRFYEKPPSHLEAYKLVVDQLWKTPRVLIARLQFTGQLRGLYAMLSGDGFRADGSLFEHPHSADPERLLNDGTGVGVPPVELGDRMADEQIKGFERFVDFAKSKGIALIGIQVPYYKRILDGMNSDPRAGVWKEFRSEQRRLYFESKGMVFFDFSDMPEYRADPGHFIDSLHPDLLVIRTIVSTVMADERVRSLLPNVIAGRIELGDASTN